MRTKNIQGYTFIELVIVLAILGLAAVSSATYLLQWTPNLRLKQTANDIYTVLQRGKLQAVRLNSCVGMTFVTNGSADETVPGGSYATFVDTDCDGTQDAGEVLLTSSNVERDVSLHQVNGNINCFTPTSVSCGSQAGNIILSNTTGKRYYRISVSAAGVILNERSGDNATWVK